MYDRGHWLFYFVFSTWMVFTAHADAEFRPARLDIYDTSFNSYLVMSPSVESLAVSLSCRASIVDDINAADTLVARPDCSFVTTATGTITTATTTTTTTTMDPSLNGTLSPVGTTPPDPNSPWEVTNSRFDIPDTPTGSSKTYEAISVRRVREPITEQIEIVVTTCCVLDSSTNTSYQGDVAVAVAVANVKPYYCSNCNYTLTNPTAERVIQNPGFVEVAPCPCDMTLRECDINCACDTECTTDNKARFGHVIPGLPGGQGAEPEEYKCNSRAFNPPDWQVLTCVYWENNAFLGLYFFNQAKITSYDVFTSTRSTFTKNTFSLAEFEKRNIDKDYGSTQYKLGLIVQTTHVNPPNSAGYLSLPQSISGGACNPFAPVQFLVPFESSCASQLTSETCSRLSTFTVEAYAMPSDPNFSIMNSFAEGSAVPTAIRYYCLTDYTAYQPITTLPLGNQSPNTVSSFPNTLATEDCYNSCDNPTCWQYNTGRSFPQTTATPPLCTTQPSIPSLNPTTGVCSNAVLDVRYTFVWSGTEIRSLEASVYVADVTIGNTGVKVAQRFSVEWQHLLNVTNPPPSDNYLNSSSSYARSGSVGYEIGKPLFSGCADRDASTGQFNSVDFIDEKQVAILRPDVDGLCENARRQFLSFGEDTTTSCALRLDFNQLNGSCTELRQLISNHLNVLMAGDVVGRYGYNDPSDENMWISVLRQNISAVDIPTPENISVDSSDNVTIFRFADDIAGVCFVPSAINLNILYAKTGAVFRHPRHEVVGAYINYTYSNWSMECMGANSQRCNASSGLVQNFFLHSSVRFIKVPPVLPAQEIRFHTRFDTDRCDSDTCYRYLENFARDECYYEICWQEIAYPLTSEYKGDSHVYTLAVFLLIVLGIVGYASVTKPGWS